MSVRLSLFLFSLIFVPQAKQLKDEGKARNTHPGTIVDAYSNKGILAKAHAYGSQHPQGQEECPVYDNSLDDQESDPASGTFTFRVPRDRSSYLAVYCQPGYISRTETTNDNSKDSERVRPDPIKLIPLKPKQSLPDVFFIAISSDLERLRTMFRLYAKDEPQTFSAALELHFSSADRKMVETIKNHKVPFLADASLELQGRFIRPSNSDSAYRMIEDFLDNARSNFVYYEKSDTDAYAVARSRFPFSDQSIIDRIRERPALSLLPK